MNFEFEDGEILYKQQLVDAFNAVDAEAVAAGILAAAAKAKADTSVQTINGAAPDGSGHITIAVGETYTAGAGIAIAGGVISSSGGGGGLPVYAAPAQTVADGNGVAVSVTAGAGNASGDGGNLTLVAGPTATAGGQSGVVLLQGGGGTAASGGAVTVAGGDSLGVNGGNLVLRGGNTGASNGYGGNVFISSGAPSNNSSSGKITVSTADGIGNNDSGSITFHTGSVPAYGTPGSFIFVAGGNTGGYWNINGGGYTFTTGHGGGTASSGGDFTINLSPGGGTGRAGILRVSSLPTVDPGVEGALWLPATGVVAISGTAQFARFAVGGKPPISPPTLTGSRADPATIAALFAAIDSYGLITDGTGP